MRGLNDAVAWRYSLIKRAVHRVQVYAKLEITSTRFCCLSKTIEHDFTASDRPGPVVPRRRCVICKEMRIVSVRMQSLDKWVCDEANCIGLEKHALPHHPLCCTFTAVVHVCYIICVLFCEENEKSERSP